MAFVAVETMTGPRHVKVTGRMPMFGYERCEDAACVVDSAGYATSCGRPACPSCGSGGTNLTRSDDPGARAGRRLRRLHCTCGHSWAVSSGDFPITDNSH